MRRRVSGGGGLYSAGYTGSEILYISVVRRRKFWREKIGGNGKKYYLYSFTGRLFCHESLYRNFPPPHGLEEVYAEYRTYFVRIAVSYVRDRMVAEDLVSDTFLKIWESRTETTPRNLPAYLLTALKRKCLDYLRDQAIHLRIQQNMHQTSARVVGERIARLEANDPQNLMMSEALAIIERELRRMPEQRRRIFIAHRYEEMSYREIATVYELSEGQVTYELRAAKEALKAALKDYLPLIGLLLNGL